MAASTTVEREQRRSGGLGGLVASWALAWSERRHAARVSDEILALYRTASVNHPDWAEREIYLLVVMARTGCDIGAADSLLQRAQESFAQWPTVRALTLCDVVHYLCVTEFLASHQDERWIHSNMGLVVSAHVPPELCVARLEA